VIRVLTIAVHGCGFWGKVIEYATGGKFTKKSYKYLYLNEIRSF